MNPFRRKPVGRQCVHIDPAKHDHVLVKGAGPCGTHLVINVDELIAREYNARMNKETTTP